MMIVVPLIILIVPLGLTILCSWYFWQRARTVSLFFIVWFLISLALNTVTFFPGEGVWVDGDRTRTPVFLALMATPIFIYFFARRISEQIGAAIDAIPLHFLVGNQVYRLAGITFYFAYIGGLYPAEVAFPAAILDVFIGLTALPLAFLLMRRPAQRLALAWNSIGLFDFGLAITVVTASVYGFVTLTPAPSALGQLPSILTAVFAVPFGIIVHLEIFRRLRASR